MREQRRGFLHLVPYDQVGTSLPRTLSLSNLMARAGDSAVLYLFILCPNILHIQLGKLLTTLWITGLGSWLWCEQDTGPWDRFSGTNQIGNKLRMWLELWGEEQIQSCVENRWRLGVHRVQLALVASPSAFSSQWFPSLPKLCSLRICSVDWTWTQRSVCLSPECWN